MQLHSVAEASGYLGSVLGVAMVVPQILRTYRNRSLPGVSAMAWALTALSCLTWMLYGVRTAELPQIPGNVLLVIGAVVVVLAVPSAVSVVRRAGGLVAGAALLGTLAFAMPAPVVGAIGFGIALVSGLPQIIVSVARRSGDSAVSRLTWGLRVACQACWLFFAVAVGDLVVAVSAAFLLSCAALVLSAELSRRPATVPVATTVLGTRSPSARS